MKRLITVAKKALPKKKSLDDELVTAQIQVGLKFTTTEHTTADNTSRHYCPVVAVLACVSVKH